MKNIVFEENFKKEIDLGPIEENHKWYSLNMNTIDPTSNEYNININNGLTVKPKKINKKTNEPQFTTTSPQDPQGGQADHIKWSALANNKNTEDHSFKVQEGEKINFEAKMSGKIYGTKNHPFKDYVENPENDLRLGDAVLMVMDPEHMIVFDFFITNTKIYAIYERGRSMTRNTDYQAYSFGIPLKDRKPNDTHLLRIRYDKDNNTVQWFIDNEEVYHAEHVGKLIDREYMYIDNGGEDKEVKSNFFQPGLALFTLMDGAKEGKGLINLTGENIYHHPQKIGKKVKFFDNESKTENRIFGQGAELKCEKFTVYYE